VRYIFDNLRQVQPIVKVDDGNPDWCDLDDYEDIPDVDGDCFLYPNQSHYEICESELEQQAHEGE
jgi:hypothetical protein|tara:strand:- start:536 stop:730 length:195 start_codon:yes stop_codon:yes gene_type:complete